MEDQLGSKQEISENKILAALSYLGILCLIPILLKRDDKFVTFHAKQGLVLFFAEIIVWFVNIIPILGQMVWILASFVFLAVSIVGIVRVWQGEYWKIPFLHKYTKKINI
ncbi:DUF4870 domain-containing protein [Candidatus Kuenenbacteria bacterium]|nr:DUF4870 domain-containing protein [Candidatus Kuenenbacteria bacterium]